MFRIDRAAVDFSPDPARIALLEVKPTPAKQGGDDSNLSPAELIERAKQDAVMIKQHALQEAEKIKKDAEMDGYNEGRSQAEKDFSGRLNEEVEAFDQMVEHMQQEHLQTMQQANVAAAKLAITIAEKILHFELDRNDEAFLFLAQEAAESMTGGKLVLRVNPEEYKRFFADGKTLSGIPADRQLAIVEDARVERGGCVVESDERIVDAGIDKQLEKVTEAFGLAESDRDDNRPY